MKLQTPVFAHCHAGGVTFVFADGTKRSESYKADRSTAETAPARPSKPLVNRIEIDTRKLQLA